MYCYFQTFYDIEHLAEHLKKSTTHHSLAALRLRNTGLDEGNDKKTESNLLQNCSMWTFHKDS